MTRQKLLKILPPTLGVLVLGGVVVGLHGALKKIGVGDVIAALGNTPRAHIIHAVLLLGLSMALMSAYDLPGISFARRVEDFPRLGLLRVGLASFCAYSLSHVLGAPALSAAAIRFRLYAQWGVPASGIGRIVTISGTSFTAGLITLFGVMLALDPAAAPLGGDTAPLLLRGLGVALLGLSAFYVFGATRWESVNLFGKRLALPGTRTASSQILLAVSDIATSGAILYSVLPPCDLSYPHLLGLYLAAFVSGLFSGIPGGVGVFDSVLLLGLSDYLSPADALGAILLFRVMYFLIPATLGGLCYAGHEFWVHAGGADKGK
ncbi:hypothetical protein [Acidocella sp.]|uniref:hypothetical protein n=1 Tax=Acidocella sp. TaxID=50710 RepID=UPI002607E962|nr:hypothetical protein [Acidocella sp.]